MTTHFVFVDAKSMVINMENMEMAPHVVQANDDSGRGSAPNSNAASSRGMFGDASDETKQINAIEQVGDGAMGTLNFASHANSHRSQGDGSSEEISRIHIVGQVEDASMGSSSHITISTSPTNPGSISSSWDGDNDDFCAELGRVYRREFRGQTVVWPHPEENIFSSAYVCPFSGECFLSGAMVERGYAGLAGDLQWYHSEDEAKTAALKRFFDCHHFRRQAPNSPADMNRHCREVPYRDTGDPVLPPAYIPQQARQRIQLYQQEALASAVPSMASSDISPLTFSNGSLTLRPPEQDTRMPPQNGVLVAPLVDRNARSVLNERYQDGIINGHHVQQCSIPDANFLVYKIVSGDQPYFTCMFVCPLFGEYFPTGEFERNPSSAHLMHGLKWYRHKSQAKAAAAARVIDCLEYREGRSNVYCVEESYLQGNGPPLSMLGQRVFSAKIRRLQAEARARIQRFKQN